MERINRKFKVAIKFYIALGLIPLFVMVSMADGAEQSLGERMLDPLYIVSLVFMVLYGLLTWSLARNLKGFDKSIASLEAKIDHDIQGVCKKTTEVNELLKEERDRINDLSRDFNKLLGEHDQQMRRGGHS